MFKLAEKLYLAQCNESQGLLRQGYSLIYSCHWPCAHSRHKKDLPQCIGIKKGLKANGENQSVFIDITNLEIPNYSVEQFNLHLNLIDQVLKRDEVVLISERGESRAPSLALLWMAFRGKMISSSSFAAARSDFTRLYPKYVPWPGWVIFFEQEWDAFR
jgi:hypothetical protein